jgi:hypothetical protein
MIRDNRRFFGDLRLEAWLPVDSLFIAGPQRTRWPISILASYTLEEVQSSPRSIQN